MSEPTAHVDTFVRDQLPPRAAWPELIFSLPELRYPQHLNAATALLQDRSTSIAVRQDDGHWTYSDVHCRSNQIAHVLVRDMKLIPGERVLLHGFNTAMTAACWLAILKAGGVVVASMPLLRAKEIATLIAKSRVTHVLCEAALVDELTAAQTVISWALRLVTYGQGGELDRHILDQSPVFEALVTYAHDPALIAFSSGTTGEPKGCVHFHRDLMAMADTFSRHILKPRPSDVFVGTPPLSFTFGLGGLLVFPFQAGASTVLNNSKGIEGLARDIQRFRATTLFTSPTAYRALLALASSYDFSSLLTCVSAGEALPRATSDAWFKTTGVRPIDGIGSTEMIHIFISASGEDIRAGATGKPVPGYEARLLDEDGNVLPRGSVGRLAVKGPTGCRYLNDVRQADYVQSGWNITGDIYREDEEGYFWYVTRADDMIVTGGYNVAGPEVENALLSHPAVKECAVVGVADDARGQIVKAYVVVQDALTSDPALAETLQNHVKATIAPYKYPRAVEFVPMLPKTLSGKIQRYKLRQPRSQDS